jgi:hypothetical protein
MFVYMSVSIGLRASVRLVRVRMSGHTLVRLRSYVAYTEPMHSSATVHYEEVCYSVDNTVLQDEAPST